MRDFTLRFVVGFGSRSLQLAFARESSGIALSHDVTRIIIGPWCAVWRRASPEYQLGKRQHSRWLLVALLLPYCRRVWRGGWTVTYLDPPPLEDIAPGCADMKWYPQATQAVCSAGA